jgi:ATP-dependent DNA helicase RecQ
MAENQSDQEYFERALSESLTTFGYTTLKEHQKSCIRKLVVDSQDVFAVLPTGFGKSLIYQVLPGLFTELHRLRHGTIKNFVVAVVSQLEYIRVQQVQTLRKLGIQAVCLDPSFDDETNDIKNESDSKVQVVYGSAEQWLENKWIRKLKNGQLGTVKVLVVDEVHTVEMWYVSFYILPLHICSQYFEYTQNAYL